MGINIPFIPLNNGVLFPLISLGTGGYNSSEAKGAYSLALRLNWTSVDTALDYGNQVCRGDWPWTAPCFARTLPAHLSQVL